MFLVDVAVPRDIDPDAGKIDNVYLYNIDDLQGVVDENMESRLNEAREAESIIDEEVARFSEWFATLEVVPTIVDLKTKTEDIVRGEMKKVSFVDEKSRWGREGKHRKYLSTPL